MSDTDGRNAGLAEAEARRRLAEDGPNELPQARPPGLLQLFGAVLREPMLLLLVACGLIYMLLGDLGESLTLLVAVIAMIGLTLYQRRRTENALAALRDLSSPRALVIRDGVRRRIPGREVVRGDYVVLSEGDRVPADGVLLDANHLRIDESLVTGESVPVAKRASPAGPLPPAGGDDAGGVYSGTLVTRGSGIARIEAIGRATEIGRIGASLEAPAADSPLQRETARLVRNMALGASALCLSLAAAWWWRTGDALQGALAGLTAAMALLPEEFPVVLTIFLAVGAWRLAQKNVLARRAAAIETLGAATILCVDKTGTLTENHMRVQALVTPDGARCDIGEGRLPEPTHRLVEFAILATRRDPFDPMERAIVELGLGDHVDAAHLHAEWTLEREYPLADDLLAMSTVWRGSNGRRTIAAKGAPEAIAELCHLDLAARARLLAGVEKLSAGGLRVLGVAEARLDHHGHDVTSGGAALPERQHEFSFEWLGLVGLADPVRAAAPAAVAACRLAGIRVLMITGDHAGTALSIARQLGLAEGAPLTGAEIEQLDEPALRARLEQCAVVARARPEHKLRIVQALRAHGHVVAMTGDGVNDAPALRAAHIGVAMGGRGTDVAREAADLIVTDDDFASIVEAVAQGRRVFANLRHAMTYIVAVHVPIAGLALLPPLVGWPLLLLPVHVAFLELIIDPACSVVFEAEPAHPDTMRREPRRADARLLGAQDLVRAFMQGLLALAAALGNYFAAISILGLHEDAARALAFAMLVCGNLALVMASRSRTIPPWQMLRQANGPLWILAAAVPACLAAILAWPPLRSAFAFSMPPALSLALPVVVAALLVAPMAWVMRRAPSR